MHMHVPFYIAGYLLYFLIKKGNCLYTVEYLDVHMRIKISRNSSLYFQII